MNMDREGTECPRMSNRADTAPQPCFSPVMKGLLWNLKKNRENREGHCASCLSHDCDKHIHEKDGLTLTWGLRNNIACLSGEGVEAGTGGRRPFCITVRRQRDECRRSCFPCVTQSRTQAEAWQHPHLEWGAASVEPFWKLLRSFLVILI